MSAPSSSQHPSRDVLQRLFSATEEQIRLAAVTELLRLAVPAPRWEVVEPPVTEPAADGCRCLAAAAKPVVLGDEKRVARVAKALRKAARRDPSAAVRAAALTALSETRLTADRRALAHAILHEADPEALSVFLRDRLVWESIPLAARRRGLRRLVDPRSGLGTDARDDALLCLLEYDPARGTAMVEQILADEVDPERRRRVLEDARWSLVSSALPTLRRIARNDPDPRLRILALQALHGGEPLTHCEIFRASTADPDPEVRGIALEIWCHRARVDAMPVALRMAEDEATREKALSILAEEDWQLRRTNLRQRIAARLTDPGYKEVLFHDEPRQLLIEEALRVGPAALQLQGLESKRPAELMPMIEQVLARQSEPGESAEDPLREDAWRVLAWLDDPRSLLLARRGLRDEHGALRPEAIERIAFSEEPDREAILAAALADELWAVRTRAVSLLRWMGTVQSAPALLQAVWDPSLSVQEEAAEALARIDDAGLEGPLADLLDRHPNALVRQNAARRLWRSSSPLVRRTLVRHLLGDPDRYVRGACAGALGRIGGRSAEFALRRCLAREPLDDVVGAAGEALGRCAGARGISSILGRLDGLGLWDGQRQLILGLGFAGVAAEPFLLRMLAHRPPDLHGAVLEALGRLGSPTALAAIRCVVQSPADAPPEITGGILLSAARALGSLRDRESAEILSRRLSAAPDAYVRWHCIWALGRIGGDAARSALEDAARCDPAFLNRASAFRQLCEVGAPEVGLAGLQQMASSPLAQRIFHLLHAAALASLQRRGEAIEALRRADREGLGESFRVDSLLWYCEFGVFHTLPDPGIHILVRWPETALLLPRQRIEPED